jgi:hypothetical protein
MDAFADERRILPEIVEHQRFEPEKSLAGRIAIELDFQRRLRGVAAGMATRRRSQSRDSGSERRRASDRRA